MPVTTIGPATPPQPLRPWQCRIVWTCWLAGGLGRLVYLFAIHPATAFVFSDMQGYVQRAIAFAQRRPEGIADTLYPPGASMLFGWLFRLDGNWALAMIALWLLSLAVMGLVWLLARRVYGATVAVIALFIATVYFPFVHYASYFLSETPFTVCLLASVWALLVAVQARAWPRRFGAALLAGLAAGLAMSFKNTVLAPFLLSGLVYALVALRTRDRRFWLLSAGTLLGFAMVLAPLAGRCTRLNEGRFCLSANNLGMNVLMGHYGRVRDFVWIDPARGTHFQFTAVESTFRGYQGVANLDFGAYDSARNLALARDWIAAHPDEALHLSLWNLWSLFAEPSLWPGVSYRWVDYGAWSQRAFWMLILLPAAIQLARRSRAMLRFRSDGLDEWLLIVPLLGLMASVFVSIAEARFRVPFDGLLIVLAAGGWVWLVAGLRLRLTPLSVAL